MWLEAPPEPQVLAIDHDIAYYDLEEVRSTRFSADDLTRLNADAKRQIASQVQGSRPVHRGRTPARCRRGGRAGAGGERRLEAGTGLAAAGRAKQAVKGGRTKTGRQEEPGLSDPHTGRLCLLSTA